MSGAGPTSLTHWEGEPTRVWAEVWGIPELEAHATLASTSRRARALAVAGAPPWTVVVSDGQTEGRGREGRRWTSEPGAGLWFSLTAPDGRAGLQLLPLRVGLAVVTVLRALGGAEDVGLKWPNDLWWRDRKLGGILCERDARGVVIGVGLNLRSPEGGGFGVPPVGLEELVGGRVARAPLLGALVARIRGLVQSGGARLSGDELDRLAAVDHLRGRAVRCDPGPGGIARGVTAQGGLRVETEQGVRTIHAGTVRPIGPPPRITREGGDGDA